MQVIIPYAISGGMSTKQAADWVFCMARRQTFLDGKITQGTKVLIQSRLLRSENDIYHSCQWCNVILWCNKKNQYLGGNLCVLSTPFLIICNQFVVSKSQQELLSHTDMKI
jgi:hypothetical protein